MPSVTTRRALLALLTMAASAALALSPPPPPVKPPPPVALPMPRFVVPDASQPLTLQRIRVQATLAGGQAQTRIELVVHNPNPRALEATLEFPLDDRQSVVGFALDVQGEMVSAVPVAKDKGRQVFDDVTRRRVDPALLEKTAGNSFKLRIYPVLPNGERRVQLDIAEVLRPDAQGQLLWRLPLDFGTPIARFDGQVSLAGVGKVQALGALARIEPGSNSEGTVLKWSLRDWQGQEPLGVRWAAPAADALLVDEFAGTRYAYAELGIDTKPGPTRLPRSLNLIWDASGSGAQRDHAREFALLDALFAAAKDVKVQLTVTRDAAEAPRSFEVKAGDWMAMRQALERLPYDGATSAGAWQAGMTATADLSLLFSDGLVNWPEAFKPLAKAAGNSGARLGALFAVNAATRFDAARLRRLAEASGGGLIDLNRLDTPQALDDLTRKGVRVVDLQAVGADSLVAETLRPEGGRLAIAARLTAAAARVTVTLEDGQGTRSQRVLQMPPPVAPAPGEGTPEADAPAQVPLAARRWAELRVAELDADRQRHRAELRRLGEQFRLVSADTSLIVLEALEDYVRHQIVPPTPAMKSAYLQRVGQQEAGRAAVITRHLDGLVRRFLERQSWWDQKYPTEAALKLAPLQAESTAPTRPMPMITMAAPAPVPAPVLEVRPAPPQAPVAAPAPARPSLAPPAPAALSAMRDSSAARLARERSEPAPAGQPSSETRIALRPWEPNAPYLTRLREAADADRYAVYLDERPSYLSSTAFYIDAAEVFFTKGQKATAIRVLSNLAEMDLENRHVLRILAYRLLQADQLALAIPLLERVRELAPDEPQSHRDLALALARADQAQRAVELLWDVARQPWDARFADIDLIALGELNAIAARNKGLDTSRIDTRLLRNLPLDLRTVLTWDADNTDIDLWVIDPDGEKAFYGHRFTRQGGALSRDFTAGYGPEEFSLRRAKPGRYEVRANFFGHNQQIVSPYTTLMLWLSTGFGTPAQKDQRVVLRLSGRGDGVLVGSFEVGKP
jgi:hypothetical protein